MDLAAIPVYNAKESDKVVPVDKEKDQLRKDLGFKT